MKINPFKAWRPALEKAGDVASVPYDVVNTKQAAALAAGNPDSFLHVVRAEIDLPEGTAIYSDAVYAKAAENLKRMMDDGTIVRQGGVTVARLQQTVPQDIEGTVADLVSKDWNHEHALDHPVEKAISLMNLDPDQPFADLSGGMRRRALLAKALVNEPDVLILDEPTNHLDIDSIQWLEDFLLRWRGTVLFVTHDRVFLRKLATRIVELDRGQLTSWE